jgi:hypothetical protein
MKERYEVNLAHTNELHPQYLEQVSKKMRGWKVISSVSHDSGSCLILWESTNGIWIEERHYENREQKRGQLTLLNNPESVRQAVERLIEH